MERRLPPLNALRAFEVAARTGSFTAAANELSVSQGAVSRHIAHLEESLGVRLFHRSHRHVRLTSSGAEYAATIRQSFLRIEQATKRVCENEKSLPVRLRAFHNFAFRWLVPRLATFQALNPDIEVQLTAAEEAPLLDAEPIDLSIHIHLPFQSGVHYDKLFALALIPVCSPAYAARIGKLNSVDDLARAKLIHSLIRPHDWQSWFVAAGSQEISTDTGLYLNNSALTYEAAINGLGIALTQKQHVQGDLDSGRLVIPWSFELTTGEHYYLAGRKPQQTSRNVAVFRKWLIEAAGTPIAS